MRDAVEDEHHRRDRRQHHRRHHRHPDPDEPAERAQVGAGPGVHPAHPVDRDDPGREGRAEDQRGGHGLGRGPAAALRGAVQARHRTTPGLEACGRAEVPLVGAGGDDVLDLGDREVELLLGVKKCGPRRRPVSGRKSQIICRSASSLWTPSKPGMRIDTSAAPLRLARARHLEAGALARCDQVLGLVERVRAGSRSTPTSSITS